MNTTTISILNRTILLSSFLFVFSADCLCQIQESSKYLNEFFETESFKWKPFFENGYKGAKSQDGKMLVPPKYKTCNYEYGHFSVMTSSYLYGVYSQEGKLIVPALYESISFPADRSNIAFKIQKAKGYGIISKKGKLIIPPEYDNITFGGDEENGYYYIIEKDGFMGIADADGKILIPPTIYNEIVREGTKESGFTYSFRLFGEKKNCSGVCNNKGKEIIRTHYLTTTDRGSYCEVSNGEQTAKINYGENKSPKLSGHLKSFRKGEIKNWILISNENNKLGCTDENNTPILACKYDQLTQTMDGKFFYAREGRYWSLISLEGESIIPLSSKFISISPFKNHIRAFTEDNKAFLFDIEGKELVRTKHRFADFLLPGKKYSGDVDSLVYYKDFQGYGIETVTGEEILSDIYDRFGTLSLPDEYFILAYNHNQVGLFTTSGKALIPIAYDEIDVTTYNGMKVFYVQNGNKKGVYSYEGHMLICPEEFSDVKYSISKKQFTGRNGKRVCTFDINGRLLTDNMPELERDKFIDEADAAFEKSNYSKAANLYGKAISLRPSATLYYNRAVSYYNNNNYSKAISDFEKCLDCNPTTSTRESALDLIGKAKIYQANQIERRERNAGAFLGLVFSTINTFSQSINNSNNNYYRNSNYESHSDIDSDNSTTTSYSSKTSKSSGSICRTCKGDGKCLSCHGSGIRTDNYFGTGQDPTKRCGVCGGDGICNVCHGKGYR